MLGLRTRMQPQQPLSSWQPITCADSPQVARHTTGMGSDTVLLPRLPLHAPPRCNGPHLRVSPLLGSNESSRLGPAGPQRLQRIQRAGHLLARRVLPHAQPLEGCRRALAESLQPQRALLHDHMLYTRSAAVHDGSANRGVDCHCVGICGGISALFRSLSSCKSSSAHAFLDAETP